MDNNETFKLNIDDSAFDEYGEFEPKLAASEAEGEDTLDASRTQVMDMSGVDLSDDEDMKIKDENTPVKPKSKKRKKKSRKRSFISGLIIGIIVVAITFGVAFFIIAVLGDFFGITADETTIEMQIEPDSSIIHITNQLKENKIIKFPLAFRLYIKYFTDDVSFQFGTKELNPGMSYDDIIKTLSEYSKSDKTVEVVIPEGYTVHQIAQLLEDKSVCSYDDFVSAMNEFDCSEYSFLSSIDNTELRMFKLEGYLFPDTYQFYMSDNPESVIRTFLDNFAEKYTSDLKKQVRASDYTLDQIITLASIVQAEAPVEEMSNVAAVYFNRINNTSEYPKLQSDPTILYAENVLKPLGASQEMLDAYNTYASNGFPVGAIGNPGLDAITATLNPSETNYYYFVSSVDMSEFYYATTYSEHLANCNKAGIN